MNVDLTKILSSSGKSAVQQIRQNMASTGTNASGKTSRSLRFVVKQEGENTYRLTLVGRPYFMTVETGRKKTPQYEKPSREFVQAIRSWLIARGKDQGAAYGIARSIHQHGTKLWQRGGRKDIVSNVLTESFYDKINIAVLDKFTEEFIKIKRQTLD